MDKIIKPSFKKPLWIARAGLYLLFPPLFIFVALPLGILITAPFGVSGFMAGLVGYVLAIGAALGVAKAMYRGTTFEITPKSVSHNLDFLWSKRKQVLLANVKEVELEVGFFQKFVGLGTVVLHTQASLAGNNKTGLSLFDIENSNDVYELLKGDVSKASCALEK